jgi:hypothetical protein
VPESVTTGTLPRASLLTATPAVRWPPVVGLKITLIAQLRPAARVCPQVLVWLKSPGLVPVIVMLEMFNVALPLLVMVIGCEGLELPTSWLLNVRLAGARLMAGALMPVPLRGTLCGLPIALSATAMAPIRVPVVVGLKATKMLQLARAARPLPQVSVSEKSPLTVMARFVTGKA